MQSAVKKWLETRYPAKIVVDGVEFPAYDVDVLNFGVCDKEVGHVCFTIRRSGLNKFLVRHHVSVPLHVLTNFV